MSPLASLAARSLWNRRGTGALTVFAVAVSVALLLGVLHLRDGARAAFAGTVSGTDLVVGARTGPLNLLLAAVFRVGDTTANVSYAVFQKVARHPDVAWAIPFSLGDSHKGYRVLGTDDGYFVHWHYGRGRALAFSAGGPFADLYDVVLGAEVADRLGYRLGDRLVVAHGVGAVSFVHHDDQPFRVAGILARTGTPVDRTVHVRLEAISAIHLGGQAGAPVTPAAARAADLEPKSISAFAIGMKSKSALFVMQRALNEYRDEALSAVIPGVALQQLWELVGVADTALLVVAGFVVLAGLLGLMSAILASLNERRREMAILRSVGARPADVFLLLVLEAGAIAAAGAALGVGLMYALLAALAPLLASRYGVVMEIGAPTPYDAALIAAVIGAALTVGAVPAWRAYHQSLADGLTVRL